MGEKKIKRQNKITKKGGGGVERRKEKIEEVLFLLLEVSVSCFMVEDQTMHLIDTEVLSKVD